MHHKPVQDGIEHDMFCYKLDEGSHRNYIVIYIN